MIAHALIFFIFFNLKPQHIPTTTICEDEQSFFERHYETLQKTHEAHSANRQGTGGDHHSRPGVVGPLGVSPATIDLMRVGAIDNDRSSKKVRVGNTYRSTEGPLSNLT